MNTTMVTDRMVLAACNAYDSHEDACEVAHYPAMYLALEAALKQRDFGKSVEWFVRGKVAKDAPGVRVTAGEQVYLRVDEGYGQWTKYEQSALGFPTQEAALRAAETAPGPWYNMPSKESIEAYTPLPIASTPPVSVRLDEPALPKSPSTGDAVGIVDEGEEGLFVELLYGPNGNPLKLGDKVFTHPPAGHAGRDDIRQAIADLDEAFAPELDLDSGMVESNWVTVRSFALSCLAATHEAV